MISYQDITQLCARPDVRILEVHKEGPKVLETAEGEIIKIFYNKKGLSSNAFRPYAIRFRNNSLGLYALGFTAPLVKSIKFCPENKSYIIYYARLPGETVTNLVKQGDTELLKQVIVFLSELHSKGVFFRAIHLSNLLYQTNHMALLDIADLQIYDKPLSLYARYRNLRHFFSNKKDFPLWVSFPLKERLEMYAAISGLSPLKAKVLSYILLKKLVKPRD